MSVNALRLDVILGKQNLTIFSDTWYISNKLIDENN